MAEEKAVRRWLTFGYYSLFNATDPNLVRPDLWATDVKNSNFTGVSVHLDNPFDKQAGVVKKDDWMFPYLNQFNYNKIDEDWVAKLDYFLAAFGSRGLDVELCLVSQFMDDVNPHPFGLWTPDQLYSSLQFPVSFAHISWDKASPQDEAHNKFVFHFNTLMGNAMNLYIDAVTKSIAKALTSFKGMRIGVKWANETIGSDVQAHKRGDRSEMNALLHDKLAALGWNPKDNPRLKSFVDREFLSSDTSILIPKRKELHASITRAYGMQFGLGAIHEIHGMCDRAAINARIAEGTAHPKDTLFSNDGMKCSKFFPDGVRDMIKMNLDGTIPFMDIKMEEAWTPWPNYKQGQINTSWKRYAPLHLELAG